MYVLPLETAMAASIIRRPQMCLAVFLRNAGVASGPGDKTFPDHFLLISPYALA